MRTLRFVTAFALLLASITSFSDGILDSEVTLVGSDESVLSVPAPALPGPFALPELDLRRPATPALPPIPAPHGDWNDPASDWMAVPPLGNTPS